MRRAAAAALWGFVAAAMAQGDPWSELAQARRDLAISEQVEERLTARIEIARSDPATGPEQRRQLEEYAARVRELVAVNRERVRQLVQAAQASGAPAGTGGTAAPPARTHVETVATLDAKLGSSLAEFDQLLLEEARRAKHRDTAGETGSAAGGGKDESAGTKSPSGGARSREGGAGESGAGQTGSSEGGKGSQSAAGERAGYPDGRIAGTDPGASGAPVVPPDIGDGRDDDIIARQIRKAAESEPDPELRKKLWDEYRKYKQGAKG